MTTQAGTRAGTIDTLSEFIGIYDEAQTLYNALPPEEQAAIDTANPDPIDGLREGALNALVRLHPSVRMFISEVLEDARQAAIDADAKHVSEVCALYEEVAVLRLVIEDHRRSCPGPGGALRPQL